MAAPFQQTFSLLCLKSKGPLAQSQSPWYYVPPKQLHPGNWKVPLPIFLLPLLLSSKMEPGVFGAAMGCAPPCTVHLLPCRACVHLLPCRACTHLVTPPLPGMRFLPVHMCRAPPSFRKAAFLSFAWKTPAHPFPLTLDVTTSKSVPWTASAEMVYTCFWPLE